MRTLMRAVRWSLPLGCLLAVACEREPAIRAYVAPKDQPRTPKEDPNGAPNGAPNGHAGVPSTQRILAATIPLDREIWFLKAMGEQDLVESVQDEFRRFLDTVRVDAGSGDLTWDAPGTWRSIPVGQYATAKWRLGMGEGVEVSVTKLGAESFDENLLLANVNRWRRQISLAPLDAAGLQAVAKRERIADRPAWLVDLVPDAAPPPRSDGPTWTLPSGWSEHSVGASSVRYATFYIGSGRERTEVALTRFPGTVGGTLANVNRWRDQAGLGPIGPTELESNIQRIDANGMEAVLVDAKGPSSRLVAAIVMHAGVSWFLKMQDKADVVEAKLPSYMAFLKSMRFGG